MTIFLTIVNGVILLGMIVVLVFMYNILNSFGELIVRFVEQNQEHFKNQKHLVVKSGELAQQLKKVPSIITNMKSISRKYEALSVKLDQQASRLEK